jgi:hypothetical protein
VAGWMIPNTEEIRIRKGGEVVESPVEVPSKLGLGP